MRSQPRRKSPLSDGDLVERCGNSISTIRSRGAGEKDFALTLSFRVPLLSRPLDNAPTPFGRKFSWIRGTPCQRGGLYGGATSPPGPPPLVASFLLFLSFSKQFTTSSPSPLHLLHASSDPNPVANLSSVAFFPLLPVVPRLLLALYTSIGLQLPLNFLPNQNPN